MTIEVVAERHGFKLTALIVTANLGTHSAVQEIPKEVVAANKLNIQKYLYYLLDEADKYRKP